MPKQQGQDEIDYWLTEGEQDEIDHWLFEVSEGCGREDSDVFQIELRNVVSKIWDVIRTKALDEIGFILYIDAAMVFKYGKYGKLHRYEPAKEIRELYNPPKEYVIAFPHWLLKESRDRIRYIVAHEFAHFMLNHYGETDLEVYAKREKAADRLAAKWGYRDPKNNTRKVNTLRREC